MSPTDKLAHVQQLFKRGQGEQKMIFCLCNNLVALPVRRGIMYEVKSHSQKETPKRFGGGGDPDAFRCATSLVLQCWKNSLSVLKSPTQLQRLYLIHSTTHVYSFSVCACYL